MSNAERIGDYEDAIRSMKVRIAEMEAGSLRHYRERFTGRLDEDDTSRMLQVFTRRIEMHECCIALLDAA